MPTKDEHLHLAARNRQVIQHLLASQTFFPEWLTTVAFYKALHIVDALLAHDSALDPPDHGARAQTLKMSRRYEKIYKHYRPLFAASCVARYLSDEGGKHYVSFSDYCSDDLVRSEILGYHLGSVCRSAKRLMAQRGARKKRRHKRKR